MNAGQNIKKSQLGIELVRLLASEGDRIFSTERARELAPRAGLKEDYLLESLHHLRRSDWIVPLRRGLYALSHTVPGMSPAHEFEIAMFLVHPAAVSHWSALSYHGLTEQLPRTVFVLTTAGSVPRVRHGGGDEEGYPVGDTRYRFVQVKPERYFGIEDVWVNEARVKITDPERTLLDGLMAPQYCGDFSEVLHAFGVRAPKLDVERIVNYALKLDAATAKRLGWILEKQKVDLAKLGPLRKLPIKGYRVLDPSGPKQGHCDSGWMIQENMPGLVLS
ncbi:MAG: type IV toxin-antitoxin system AbiEi family antitoxin domain-containing protein [Elusimicrobia bacterium]|nr:type IV toxin-antitoxin system AbiEi family antitoxin domain-containing protein [Elusimicrobiota bacterium]